jgi:hypothetical protein
MEVTGKIEKIGNEQQISTSFKKREVVIRTEEQYPQPLMLEFTQDKTNLVDGYNVGDLVTVSINIRGREWTSPKGEVKYFISLQGWRIQGVQAPAGAAPSAPSSTPPNFETPPGKPDFSLDDTEDDLPF